MFEVCATSDDPFHLRIGMEKVGDAPADGDSHQRTPTHGYGYGMRLG